MTAVNIITSVSKYERARQQIEKRAEALKPQAEADRQTAVEQLWLDKLERERAEERERRERAVQELKFQNRQAVIELLSKLNTEIFGNKGEVNPWRKTEGYYMEAVRYPSYDTEDLWLDGESHNHVKLLESRLEINEIGRSIVVDIPLTNNEYVTVSDGGLKGSLRRNPPYRLLSLGHPSDIFRDKLEGLLLEIAIELEAQRRSRI